MKYTNNKNLPDAICKAILWAQSRHVSAPGAYGSVTELNGPPLMRWLKRKHKDDESLSVDFSRMLWQLDGVFAHELFSRHGGAGVEMEGNIFIEQTMAFTVPVSSVGVRSVLVDSDSYVISFTPDLVTDGHRIQDYKKTSVFNVEKVVKTGVMKRDWEEQLNVYAEGLLRNTDKLQGFDPKTMEIVSWMRDWGPRHVATSDCPVKKMEVRLWPQKERCDHICKRLALHASTDNIPFDGSCGVPEACTREERWHKTFAESSFVPGPRCKGYCDYSKVCPYNVEYMEEKGKDEEEDL